MQRWTRFILAHRLAVSAALLLVTVAAGAMLSQAVVASSIARLFLGESPAYLSYLERMRDFGSDEVALFGYESPDLLSPAGIERLRNVVEKIQELRDVGRVDTVLDVQQIARVQGGLHVSGYVDEAELEPKRRAALLQALRQDEAAAGTLISADGRCVTVIVEFLPDPSRPAERGPVMLKEIEKIFADAGFAADELHSTGMLPALSATMDASRDSLSRLFPLVNLVLFITVLLLFKGLLPVFVSMGVSLLAVVWSAGFAVLLDREVSIMMAMMPAVVLIVGFSDVIHLYSAYLLELRDGRDKIEAIVASTAEVGRACIYTSATTFIGFLCLSLVPTPAFRHLGLVLGFGVAVALLIAVTAMPVVLSLLPAPKVQGQTRGRLGITLLDPLIGALHRLAVGWPRLVVTGFAVVALLSVAGISQVEIETDVMERLDPESRTRKDNAWFEARFAGDVMVEVFVHASAEKGAMEPKLFAAVAAMQEEVARLPGVDDVGSLVTLVRRIHGVLSDDGVEGLPTTRKGLAETLFLFEMQGGRNLERLIDFDRKTLRMAVRIRPGGVRAAARVGDRIAELARRHVGDLARVEVTGMSVLIGNWLDEMMAGQRRGLALSMVLIAFMMMLVCRSWRLGLWSMLPNALPLLVLGGWVGGTWHVVDSDTFAVAMLAIGIGVDDTIHFVSRYRIESQRCDTDEEAIKRTFDFAGRAIVMTTVILVLGFLPMASSTYFSTKIMGTLLPMTLAVALLADLLLVPALVRLGPMAARAHLESS